MDPVTLGDLADYQGEVVPDAVKQEWLDRITAEGSEQGSSGFDGSWLTLQADQFAFQLSSTGRAAETARASAAGEGLGVHQWCLPVSVCRVGWRGEPRLGQKHVT